MNTYTIDPARLARLQEGVVRLDNGAHDTFEDGHCAMEVVSWLAGLGHTDAPECASPVLRRFTIALNDRWDDEQRQTLVPFLPRMVGTAHDGKDGAREQLATRFLLERLLGPWLRLAGLDAEADRIPATLELPYAERRRVIAGWRDKAWEVRRVNRDRLEAKVRKHLKAQGKSAVAAAAAVDAAAAVAVDAAAAAAVAVDAAAAAAAAVDAAAAVAVDAAVDAAAAVDDPWGTGYNAAYKAAKKYYAEHPETLSVVTDLAAHQKGVALELLDLLIDPTKEA